MASGRWFTTTFRQGPRHPIGACGADRGPESSPPARAVPRNPFRFLRAARLSGFGLRAGTAYCQGFPISHFGACEENTPAFDVYGRLVYDDLTFKGEFARTTAVWPGTFNPGIPQFAASKVTSFDIGAKYRHGTGAGPVDLSAEFSRLMAGPDGAPWERQDQIVLGVAWFAWPNAKLFAEYIHVEGFTPLSFLSGGSVRDDRGEVVPDQTHSDSSARSDVLMIGVNVAF